MALVVSHNSLNTWILLAVPLPQVQCSWIQIMQQSFLSSHVSAGAGQGGSKKRPTGKSKPPTRHSSSSSDSDYEELLHNTPHAKSGAGKGGSKRRPTGKGVQKYKVEIVYNASSTNSDAAEHSHNTPLAESGSRWCNMPRHTDNELIISRDQTFSCSKRRGSGNKTLQVPQKINATTATAFATPRSWVLVSVPENVQLAATVDYLVTITSC